MNRLTSTFLFIFLFFKVQSQQIVITGPTNNGNRKLSKVIINWDGIAQYGASSDTILLGNHSFSYTRKTLEPERLSIKLYFVGGESRLVEFWATSGKYELNYDENLAYIDKEGDTIFENQLKTLEKEIDRYNSILKGLLNNVTYENRPIAEAEEQIKKLKDSIANEIDNNIYKRYIQKYPNEPIALYTLIQYSERPFERQRVKFNPEEIIELLERLSPEINKLPSANLLRNKISIAKKLVIGGVFEDIQLPDALGKKHSISSYKGRYLLVDFWASWCMPCREEFPFLLKTYEKYKHKGFEILSISLDSQQTQWKEAIRKDKIDKWIQLIDQKAISRKIYSIRFIPENYLLDPMGKIVAKNLRGSELIELLGNIFKK